MHTFFLMLPEQTSLGAIVDAQCCGCLEWDTQDDGAIVEGGGDQPYLTMIPPYAPGDTKLDIDDVAFGLGSTGCLLIGAFQMRTDLDHLPAAKQRELDRVLKILFEEFGEAHAEAKGRRKQGRIVKVILYGSHARGGWVDEPHTAKGYVSDFDLLIIVNQQELADRDTYWSAAEARLNAEYALRGALRTPVNFIVHSLKQVNDGLAHGRFFFMDIARDGIALYEIDDRPLHKPKPKTPEQALAMAREYFEEWLPSAMGTLDTARYVQNQGRLKEAAFNYHQTTERLYHCILLVLTFYTPHVHNLGFLRTQAERLDLRLFDAWPRDHRKDRAVFEKLKDAYVKARYSKDYRISEDELTWLGERVEALGRIVHTLCVEQIATLENAARNQG